MEDWWAKYEVTLYFPYDSPQTNSAISPFFLFLFAFFLATMCSISLWRMRDILAAARNLAGGGASENWQQSHIRHQG